MWRYYNHSLIPECPPNVTADVTEALESDYWKNKQTFFICYTSDYGSDKYKEWYYCIKDNPLDLDKLKAKRRYEINKGEKNFKVKEIEPEKYKEELYRIYSAAVYSYKSFSSKLLSRNEYYENVKKWSERHRTFGAFDSESGILAGFIQVIEYSTYVDFNGCKSDPAYEKKGCNAALIAYMCKEYDSKLSAGGFLICDGQKTILHETNFQGYLEKYFGFRKVNCKLNIVYKKYIYLIILLIWPFRKLIDCLSWISLSGKLNAILKMEEIRRKQEGFND